MDNPKVFADKLRIERDDFEEFEPKGEDLGAYYVDIVNQLV
jgi:hypothetical protein